MDIINISFEDIEKEFNNFVNNEVKTSKDIYPERIKSVIYDSIKKKYSDLKISDIDYGYNKFVIKTEYKRNFKNIKDFDKGNVEIVFSISNAKTDTFKKDYKEKKKYVQMQKQNPIKFVEASLRSYTVNFDWVDENNPLDISVTSKGYSSGKEIYIGRKDKKMNLNNLIVDVINNYEEKFIISLYQPWVNSIAFKGSKHKSILEVLDDDLKQKVIDFKFDFKALSKTIIDKNLLTIT